MAASEVTSLWEEEVYINLMSLLKLIGGKEGKMVDIVLGCVDNFEARVATNKVFVTLNSTRIYFVMFFLNSNTAMRWFFRPACSWDVLGWNQAFQRTLFLDTFSLLYLAIRPAMR